MPIKTYESENRKFIISVIVNNFVIDADKISIKEQWGWNFILFDKDKQQYWNNSLIEHKFREYEICHFTEDAQKIIIYLNEYAFEDAGLGGISKESAQSVADKIKELSKTNKEIYVYETSKDIYVDDEIAEGVDKLDGYSERLLYPEKKGIFERMFRK